MSVRSLLLALFLCLSQATSVSANSFTDSWNSLEKENKMIYTNVGMAGLITVWGLVKWNYFQSTMSFKSEGWFGRNTDDGGADKLGHAYSTYLLSHILASRYEAWGYDNKTASLYAALSSYGIQGFMELGDAFSGSYGFSYEDLIANTVGGLTGYFSWRYPSFKEKFDFRIEYIPSSANVDFFTDYDEYKYLAVFKLAGVDGFREGPLSYLELHAGYFTRGYQEQNPVSLERNVYVGVGINLSQIFRNLGYKKTAAVFNYYQLPYTYLSGKRDLNK